MLKPMPMRYTPDLSHLENCTLCANEQAVASAARRHRLRPVVSGQAHLLVDEAPLEAWSDVVLEQEPPRKARARFRQPHAAFRALSLEVRLQGLVPLALRVVERGPL